MTKISCLAKSLMTLISNQFCTLRALAKNVLGLNFYIEHAEYKRFLLPGRIEGIVESQSYLDDGQKLIANTSVLKHR